MLWKQFLTVISFLILTFYLTSCSSKVYEDDFPQMANDLHQKALVLDSHVDIPGNDYCTGKLDPGIDNPELKCDLIKMKKGGVDGIFLAVFVSQQDKFDDSTYADLHKKALEGFTAIKRIFNLYPEKCELAITTDDLLRINKSGKKAIMIGIENGYAIGNKLENIQEYYNLGARYITLSHWRNNQICDASTDEAPKHGGLSDFGKEVIKEMNRLGIMCDASHIAESSFWDLLNTSSAPVICSHSGAYAITNHPRNLTDEQLKALAKNGGVIQIDAVSSFIESTAHQKLVDDLIKEFDLGSRHFKHDMTYEVLEAKKEQIAAYEKKLEEREKTIPAASIKDFVDHIDHAVKVAGVNHVGIGTDFDGGAGVPGFNNHSEALNVTIELLKRGYSEDDIIKIWGGNLLRVWKDVEKISVK